MKLTNEALLASLRHDIPSGTMSSITLSMLAQLVMLFSQRMNMYYGHTLAEADLEDMRQHALEYLLVHWSKFNLTMSNKPFAYYTQCVHGSMLNYLSLEQRQSRVKECLQEHFDSTGGTYETLWQS